MKKTYNNPTMKVVELKTRNILMVSAEINGSQSNEAALGRDYDFEDEEF